MEDEIYVTIERGSTEFLARVLEPDKPPYYFVPNMPTPITLRSVLCAAVNNAYSNRKVTFVSETLFNLLVKQADKRIMALPDDWPDPVFQIG